MPIGPAGASSGPRNRDSAKVLVEWMTLHKTRMSIGTAFHIREDVYQLTSKFLQKPEEVKLDFWWLEMVQRLSTTIADDDLMAALPRCGWKNENGAWYPPEEK